MDYVNDIDQYGNVYDNLGACLDNNFTNEQGCVEAGNSWEPNINACLDYDITNEQDCVNPGNSWDPTAPNASYQTDTLFTPTGVGADQVSGEFRGGFSGAQVIGACLDENGEIVDRDIRSQQDCTGSDNRWDPNFLITSDTSTGGCFENGRLLTDITSPDLCTGGGKTWDPNYLRQTELLSGPNALDGVLENINNGRVSDVTMVDNVHTITYDSTSTDYFTENSLQVASGLSRTFRPDNTITAVKGLVEQSALSDYFFSPENTKVIQDTIRFRVYQNTQFVIDYQSPEELYIIMRSIMLQHANFKVSTNDIIYEIQGLNKMVVDYSVGEVTSNVQQYQGYLKDLESLPTPMDRPTYNGGSDNNTYDISNFIGV